MADNITFTVQLCDKDEILFWFFLSSGETESTLPETVGWWRNDPHLVLFVCVTLLVPLVFQVIWWLHLFLCAGTWASASLPRESTWTDCLVSNVNDICIIADERMAWQHDRVCGLSIKFKMRWDKDPQSCSTWTECIAITSSHRQQHWLAGSQSVFRALWSWIGPVLWQDEKELCNSPLVFSCGSTQDDLHSAVKRL